MKYAHTTQGQVIIMEIPPQDLLEKRMGHVTNLVSLAEAMGYDINGFMDENDLLKKMRNVELSLLSDFIEMKDGGGDELDQLRAELKLEKFHAIACRILDALEKY